MGGRSIYLAGSLLRWRLRPLPASSSCGLLRELELHGHLTRNRDAVTERRFELPRSGGAHRLVREYFFNGALVVGCTGIGDSALWIYIHDDTDRDDLAANHGPYVGWRTRGHSLNRLGRRVNCRFYGRRLFRFDGLRRSGWRRDGQIRGYGVMTL